MLIAVEGIDGGGKATQAKRLHTYLQEQGHVCSLMSFPAYERTTFGPHIRRYLRGEFGDLSQNHPFLAALLYGIDRFERRDLLWKMLRHGHHVVCDRYVPSNIAHQCAKLDDWDSLRFDIEVAEYRVFAMPQPDIVILLDLTAEQSYRRTRGRGDESDIHQDSLDYLDRTRDVYRNLALDENWHTVACFTADGRERTVDEIHAEVVDIVTRVLEAQPAT